MLRASAFTAASLFFLALPVHSRAAGGPIRIPGPSDGYLITKNESTRRAPSGYEGRTDISTLTAVGNTPATMGKRIVARFELGNQIKTCPAADGTAEGKGVFSMSIDYTDRPANGGGGTLHIEMKADGRYRGQVGDDAWIMNPVNAEIDYTYTQTGTLRDPSGAIATPAGSNVTQHITIPFTVSRDLTAPSVGAFSGGDPTQGRYAEALSAGTALVYWAGVYYSTAQTKWRQDNTCVDVDFTPPSYTVRLVPGAMTRVNAEIKTKAGASVKGTFSGARARSGLGTVLPAIGTSPMAFTFTAPTQRVANASFVVNATSRAGIATGEWFAGLGTDWSGRISFTYTFAGDQGGDELLTWSNSSVTQITIEVRNGKATAKGYTEVHNMGEHRRRSFQAGVIFQSSDRLDGKLEDDGPADFEVINPSPDTYVVSVMYEFNREGKSQAQMCVGGNPCTQSEQQLIIAPPLPGVGGKIDDPNHLRGTKSDTKPAGYRGTGTVTSTLTWDLARQGSAR